MLTDDAVMDLAALHLSFTQQNSRRNRERVKALVRVIERLARAQAFEEAANAVEDETCDQTEYRCATVERCAAAIRALKDA